MKISQIYKLNKTQYELDFVDIDPEIDTPLFLDPYYISKCDFDFAITADSSIRSYFEFLLTLLRNNDVKEAEELFSYLGENNDICFGMSRGKPNGHGMGPKDTSLIFQQLLQSNAIKTGVMEDIEDFRIFVPNVDKDKVSDMTANIIKIHLLEYTKEQCFLHNIPLTPNIPSGMYWNQKTKSWDNNYTERLILNNKPILLVPKRIVSYSDKYTPTEYRQHFVLNYLQNEHLRLQTALMRTRKDKSKYVTKKSVIDSEETMDKDYLAKFTKQHPEIFKNFKEQTSTKLQPIDGYVTNPLDITSICKYLSDKLSTLSPGSSEASNYHNLIIGILELLFYPNLSTPKKETPIHEGRKRIDITFNNSSSNGFFFNLPTKDSSLNCPFIFIECKNYVGEVKNPELDQLSGRFSPRRGRVGILTCRALDESNSFMKRCSDTLNDGRGLIIPITDIDLNRALSEFPLKGTSAIENILNEKYQQIVFPK